MVNCIGPVARLQLQVNSCIMSCNTAQESGNNAKDILEKLFGNCELMQVE